MRRPWLWMSLIAIIISPAFGSQVLCGTPKSVINFNEVEDQAWRLSDDQVQELAQKYLTKELPHGISSYSALAELTKAGAKCSTADDALNPYSFFCDYSRPGHGLGYFVIQIDWLIVLNLNSKEQVVESVEVKREKTGL